MYLLFAGLFALALASPSRPKKQYRNDYVYNAKSNAFYKLHIEWVWNSQAKTTCQIEGAELMVPKEDDIRQLHGMLKDFPDIGDQVWVANDGLAHESAEEQPIINLENPIDTFYVRKSQCEVLTRHGELQTSWCYMRLPFICKVEAATAPYDPICKVHSKGYRYYESVGSCYKISQAAYSWNQAYAECRAEGSHLVILNSETERQLIYNITNAAPPVEGVTSTWFFFAGFRAHKASDKCEVLTRRGELQISWCYTPLPFICKVEAATAPYDPTCKVHSKGYRYYESVGSCYKISQAAYSWNQAYAECRAEGSHLVILNSEAERQLIYNITNAAPPVEGATSTWFFFAGFRAHKTFDNVPRVFKTIFNQTLEDAGFAQWSPGEPNNALGNEYCGTIFKNDGKFNDIDCAHTYPFICEKEVTNKSVEA